MKGRALPFPSTLGPDVPMMGLDDLLAERQPQAGTSDAFPFSDFPPLENPEKLRQFLGRDPYPVIPDRYPHERRFLMK